MSYTNSPSAIGIWNLESGIWNHRKRSKSHVKVAYRFAYSVASSTDRCTEAGNRLTAGTHSQSIVSCRLHKKRSAGTRAESVLQLDQATSDFPRVPFIRDVPAGSCFRLKTSGMPSRMCNPDLMTAPGANWICRRLGYRRPIFERRGGGTGRLSFYGIGWYRKKLSIPATDAGKSIFLDIDGAMSYATVWINGHLAGGWPYGYASWRIDLTPYIQPGGVNQIAIRLDNPANSSRWYPGGGIYRNVWLVKTSPCMSDNGGLGLTTPEVSNTSRPSV